MNRTQSSSRRRAIRAGAMGAALALLVTAAPVAAQDSYEAPPSDITAELTISNWGDPNDQAVYADVAARFKEKYPNVTVNDNFVPITTWTDYVNKLVADIAAGNPPDVINIAIEGVRLGIDKDLFVPLDDFAAGDPEAQALLADVDSRLLSGLSLDDSLYLLPGTWNTMLMYYNTALFEEAGIERPADDWTWDDFLAIAQQLTTGEGADKQWGYVHPWFNFGITPWLYSNGTSQLNDDWTASNLNAPEVAETMAWVRDLSQEHGVAPDPAGADPYQLFPTGDFGMTGAGHWVVGSFAEAGFDTYDVLPWPNNGTQSSVYGVAGYGIHPSSENQALAWEYIKELGGVETQEAWVGIGAANPSLISVASSDEFLAYPPHSDLYYGAIEYAQPVASPTVFNVLEPAFMRAVDSIMAGTAPEEALAEAHTEVQEAFDFG
jgi:multiple sugar transport system substrate-binding protein